MNIRKWLKNCLLQGKIMYCSNSNRSLGKKFDFLIIGAQKCGTTALFDYLYKHPYCIGVVWKETLFVTSRFGEKPSSMDFVDYFSLKDLFRINKDSRFFEATPDNVYEEIAPARIYNYNPKMKMIFLVREPVSRAISEYNMACWLAKERDECVREDPHQEYFEYLKHPEKYTFSWFVEEEFRKMKETNSYKPSAFHYPDFIRRGLYSDQLERYYRYFSPEQILILEDKDLKERKRQTLSVIEDFLGIPHYEWPEADLVNSNIGVYTQQVPAECKQSLKEFFKRWNELFFEMIGRRMDW